MIFSSRELRELVIADTLHYMKEWSAAAENLLLGTAIQESGLGFSLKSPPGHFPPPTPTAPYHYLVPGTGQHSTGPGGPAFVYQQPGNWSRIWATAIAWCQYRRANCRLPAADDIEGLARIWHRHFHSHPTGSVREFVRNYRDLAGDRHIRVA